MSVNPVSPANNNSPYLIGIADEKTSVEVYIGSTCNGFLVAVDTAELFAAPGIQVSVPDDSTTTFSVIGVSGGSRSLCSNSLTYVEDSTPPIAPSPIAMTPAGPANGNSPQVSGLAETGSTVNIYATNNCSGAIVATGSAATFVTGIAAAVSDDTTTSFTAKAVDVAGNISACSTSVSYTEDSTAPTAPSGVNDGTTLSSLTQSPAISWTGSTDTGGSGIDHYEVAIGTSSGGTQTKTWTTLTSGSAMTGLTLSTNTTYYASVRAIDVAGNVSSVGQGNGWLADTSAPTIAITTPAAASFINIASNTTTFTVSGTCSESSQAVTVKIDGSTASSQVGGTCNGTTFTSTVDVTGLSAGARSFTAVISDAASNTTTSAAVSVTKDVTAPTAPSSVNDGVVLNSLTTSPAISWTASTDTGGSGIDHYEVAIGTSSGGTQTKTWTTLTSGSAMTGLSLTTNTTYYASVRAIDVAGNVSSVGQGDGWLADTSAPTIAITTPAAVSFINIASNTTTFTVSGTCSESSQAVTVKIDGSTASSQVGGTCNGTTFTSTVDVMGLSAGARSFTAVISDAASNTTTSAAISVTKDVAAPTAPSGVNDGTTLSSLTQSPAISWTASTDTGGSGIDHYEVAIGTSAGGTQTKTWTTLTSGSAMTGLTLSTNTTYYASVRAIDVAGNVSSVGQGDGWLADTSAPTIAITTPAAASFINIASNTTTFTVSGTCSESSQAVTVKIDGFTASSQVGGTCNGTTFTSTVDVTGLSAGARSFTAVISDAASNTTTSAAISVTKDVTAPNAATSLGWVQASPYNSTSVTASWTKSTSTDLANQKIQFYADGTCTTTSGSLIDLGSATAQTQAFTGVNGTTYTHKITSIDAAGNSTASACSSAMLINVDTTAPVIAITAAPVYVNIANQAAYVVSGTCSDNVATGTITVTISDGTNSKSNTGSCTGGGYSISVNTTTSTPGTLVSGTDNITVTAQIFDTANNSASVNVTRSKDTNDPTVGMIGSIGVGQQFHACALVKDGVKCWGRVDYGLGDGTSTSSSVPIQVKNSAGSAALSGAQAVSTGGYHTCAIVSGGAQCWGRNDYGQSGDGTTTTATLPVQVSGLTSGVQAIAAGNLHACALRNGGVWCWGYNGTGQLGDGTTTNSSIPVQVSGLTAGVTAITAGDNHTCAIVNGAAKCWGYNGWRQIGDGTNTDRLVPTQVSGLTSGVTAIAAGSKHSCAVINGGARCWGNNGGGKLGDGTVTNSGVPVQVSGLTAGVTAVAVGIEHSCAVVNGGAKCWGAGSIGGVGVLGDGTNNTSAVPVDVSGGTSGVQAIAAGADTSCVLINGAAKCWGYNASGQLGNNSTSNSNVPAQVVGITGGVQVITAGNGHTCALINGGVQCWGFNLYGQLGDNSTTDRFVPVQVSGLTTGVTAIAAGTYHTCALKNGGAWCWGRNEKGQLGDNTVTNRLIPIQVKDIPGTGNLTGVQAIAAGDTNTCALVGGGVQCWGWGASGQLGNNSTADSLLPVQVKDIPGTGNLTNVQAIAVGSYYSCAMVGGGALCWGYNGYGNLGDNTTGNRQLPIQVKDIPGTGNLTGVQAIMIGDFNNTCALVNGGVQCWGYNAFGQLGDNTVTDRHIPVQVKDIPGTGNLTNVQAISINGYNACAMVDGGAQCWGRNNVGNLGDSTTTDRHIPVRVKDIPGTGNLTNVQAITGGNQHTCVFANGKAQCWGYNGNGQLGDGTGSLSLRPVNVLNVP